LVENLSNPQPQVVHSRLIADKLKMSLKDTCQLLKIMHEMGVVVSDIEGENSLITREGLNLVHNESYHLNIADK
jgi:serine/threonine protein kinase